VGAGVFQNRGVNYCSWDKDAFMHAEVVDPSLDAVKSLGANLVQINWRIMFNDVTGAYVPNDPREESLENIATVIDKAHARGMDVALMPHLSSYNDGGNMNIWTTNEATLNKAQLFNDYNAYMAQVAELGQQKGVAFIVMGVENNIIDTGDRGHWVNIINTIRSRYSGALTYSALANIFEPNRDIKDVVFWDLMDFISCSIYPNLTRDTNASYAELIQGWYTVDQCDKINCWTSSMNWIDYIRSVSEMTGKRIYFSEMGFPAYDGGATTPSDMDIDALQDLTEQWWATQGAFDVWDNYADREIGWLMGISMWSVCPSIWWDKTQPWYVNGYEPFGKPVENTIRHWFKVVPIQDFINKYHVLRHGTRLTGASLNSWSQALWSRRVSGTDYIMALWGSPEQAETGEFYFLCDDIGIRAN